MKKKILIATVSLTVIAIAVFFGGRSLLKTLYPMKYSQFVEVYAEKNNLDKNFVYAVIECESGFDPQAVSSTGAVGLMQIMPDTFTWIGGKLKSTTDFDEASDPEISIKYGCWFYGYLIKKYGSEETAVTAYHAGMGNVDKWLKDERYSRDGKTLYDMPFPATKEYSRKVMKVKEIYSKLYK